MPVTLLAIGESLTDVVQTADGRTEHPGGSPLNIAYGLARLGESVALLTAFGPDRQGAAIEAHLASVGVVVLPESHRSGRTSSATAHLAADGSATYDFDLDWSLPDDVAVPDADIVHVGSIGAFLEPGGSRVVSLVTAASGLVAFDPNIRPSIIGTRDERFARYEQIARASAIVKMSDEDAAWLYPGASLSEVVDSVIALGPALVAITRGPDGALLGSVDERVDVSGLRVDVADTIGAGDSFMAGLLHRVARLLDSGVPASELRAGFDAATLRALGEFAVRCASITVSRPGANPPTLAELSPVG